MPCSPCQPIPSPYFSRNGSNSQRMSGMPGITGGDIVIGNDVWIGYEAVILAGVTIGDGAIIGTRALVTRDVAPYTIVGGVPARELRLRFPEETIAELLTLKWWDWPIELIQSNIAALQSGDIRRLKAACPHQTHI